MARDLKMTVNLEALNQAQSEFVFALGHAIGTWADVERGLYYWFAGITKLPDGMCRAIFYGTRGFAARLDILGSILPFSTILTEDEIKFIKAAISKARLYSVFRNSIAHGEPMPIITDDPKKVFVQMAQARDLRAKEISLDEIKNSIENFSDLADLIINSTRPSRNRAGESLEGYLSRLLQLPNQPNCKSDPIASESGKQPKGPLHRNKKAHRAAEAAKKSGESPQ